MGCFIKPKQGIAIRCTEHHGCAYIAPAGTYDPKLAEEIIGTTAAAAAQKGRSGKLDFCRVCWAAKMKRVSVKSGVRTSV